MDTGVVSTVWTRACKYLFESLILILLYIYPNAELLGHMVILFLIFLRDFHTVFHSGYAISHFYQQCDFSTSLEILLDFLILFFYSRLLKRYEGIAHCGFDFAFHEWLVMLTISCAFWLLVYCLWKNPLPIFQLAFHCWEVGVLYIFYILTPADTWVTNIFSHSIDFFFHCQLCHLMHKSF